MSVAPHPHTGLQTVSWLFTGEIEHRDSAGHHAMVRPGRAEPDDRRPRHQPLRGLHAGHDHAARRPAVGGAAGRGPRRRRRASSTTRRPTVAGRGWEVRVFLGSLLGSTSPVATATPLLGAEIVLEPGAVAGARRRRVVRARACSSTRVSSSVDGTEVEEHELAYVPPGSSALRLAGRAGRLPAAAARRSAVRRADRDVVELRRPHATRRSSPSATRGRPSSPTVGTSTAGSASRSATRCRRSRRPPLPQRQAQGTSLIRRIRGLPVVGARG